MPKFAKLSLTIVLIALFAGAGTWFWYPRSVPPLIIPGAQTASPPLTLEPFALIDHRKQPFTNERMKGHWSIAFFGYTHCADACPTILAVMKEMLKLLDQRDPQLAATTEFLFFSVDPFRDTPERLADHVTYFSPKIIGITGDPQSIHRLTQPIGIAYDYEDTATGEVFSSVFTRPAAEEYIATHFDGLSLFDSEGRLVANLLSPHTPREYLDLYLKIRRHYED